MTQVAVPNQSIAQSAPQFRTYAEWRASLRNRFRVRVGKHTAKEPLFDEAGNPVVDNNPDSKTFGKQVTVNRIYQARTDHDIIETDKDLVAIFNSPGSEKFERVHVDDHRQSIPAPLPVYQQGHVSQQVFNPSPAQQVQATAKVPPAPAVPDTLDTMSVKELQAVAAAEEITLAEHLTKPNAKKDDLLKAIRAAVGPR